MLYKVCVTNIKIGSMFGFTTISIDAKGRLAIPAKYRDHLQAKQETQIVVTRDPQYPALKIYPGSEWTQIAHGLQSLQGPRPNSSKSSMDNIRKCER